MRDSIKICFICSVVCSICVVVLGFGIKQLLSQTSSAQNQKLLEQQREITALKREELEFTREMVKLEVESREEKMK